MKFCLAMEYCGVFVMVKKVGCILDSKVTFLDFHGDLNRIAFFFFFFFCQKVSSIIVICPLEEYILVQ